jgi:hypothetical protein
MPSPHNPRSDIDFEELLVIRFLYDILIKLNCPKPRISQLYNYWDPIKEQDDA